MKFTGACSFQARIFIFGIASTYRSAYREASKYRGNKQLSGNLVLVPSRKGNLAIRWVTFDGGTLTKRPRQNRKKVSIRMAVRAGQGERRRSDACTCFGVVQGGPIWARPVPTRSPVRATPESRGERDQTCRRSRFLFFPLSLSFAADRLLRVCLLVCLLTRDARRSFRALAVEPRDFFGPTYVVEPNLRDRVRVSRTRGTDFPRTEFVDN